MDGEGICIRRWDKVNGDGVEDGGGTAPRRCSAMVVGRNWNDQLAKLPIRYHEVS